MEYPKFVWDKNITEQLNIVRTNMSKDELAKFKNQFTLLILDDSPSLEARKYYLLSYLSRKYNIKPTFNPTREHWLIRLVNDYVDGKVQNTEEFIERLKERKDDKEI